MTSTRRLVFSLLICGLIWALSGPVARAQTAPAPSAAAQNAEQTREQFYAVIRQYSPTLGQLFRLDPGLMSPEDYLVPYPAVSPFLKQHPEILRNPDYYLSRYSTNYSYYYDDPATRAWNDITEGVTIFAVVATIAYALGWLLRTAIDYRRWGRLAKVQAEAHTKLLDRFTGNDELLAYVQSPAGSRFLKSAPIALDGGPKTMSVPLTRILWSMQAGIVLAAAGIGLSYVSGRIEARHAEPIFTFSVLLLSVGVGFFLSAGLSFVMSKRLGLLNGPSQTTEE